MSYISLNQKGFDSSLSYLTLKKETKVAVAVSGGMDSMCLASLLKNSLHLITNNITTITVDHNLRPESSTRFLLQSVLKSLKVLKVLTSFKVLEVLKRFK